VDTWTMRIEVVDPRRPRHKRDGFDSHTLMVALLEALVQSALVAAMGELLASNGCPFRHCLGADRAFYWDAKC
jgi:hypothetical protein